MFRIAGELKLGRVTRFGLFAVLVVAGLVIAIRLLAGPFDAPVKVRTPLNPEGWFGLAFLILLATAAEAGERQPHQQRSAAWNTVAIAMLIGFTIAAFRRTLGFYFLSDDFVLVKLANTFQFAVWPLLMTPGGDGFFRPAGNISMALTAKGAGVNPVAWHAVALALHAGNVIMVFMLAASIGASRLAAFFAAMLFAIHGTRPEAAAWIAGRFDLLATFFVLIGLLFFIRSHGETSPAGHLYKMAALISMVLAILSKESAYIFPLLLVLFLIAKHELRIEQIRRLIPFFVTAAALFVYRLWLFAGIGGYRDETGKAQALIFGLATLKALFVRIWTALFFPINWSTEPSTLLGVLMLAYMGAVLWISAARPNRATVLFGLGFVFVCAIPPLHLLVIGAELGNSRLLYLPSVGFCIMLAVASDSLRSRPRRLVSGIILAFHFAALQHNLDAWEYASQKARRATLAADGRKHSETTKLTDLGAPGTVRGVPLFANVYLDDLVFVRSRIEPDRLRYLKR